MKKILFVLFLCVPMIANAAPPARIFTYTTGDVIEAEKNTANEDAIFGYLTRGVDTYLDSSITTDDIFDGTISNADISTSAAIAYSKVNLTGSITNTDISSSAAIADSKLASITTAGKVNASAITGGLTLPSGAVFMMLTGSCPTGSTDVSATYANKFLRISATQGTTGGGDTASIAEANLPSHTHAAGTLTGGAHNHTLQYSPGAVGGANTNAATKFNDTTTASSPNALVDASVANYLAKSGGAVAVTGSTGAIGSGTALNITNPFLTCKLCQVD